MWNTSQGQRVLTGPEADVFRDGVDNLVFWIETTPETWKTGVRRFDGLTPGEQLASLEHVARAPLVKRVACPAPTAVAEATIAAVYRTIADEIGVEIDDATGDEWRQKVLRACRAFQMEELPELACTDASEWRDAVDRLVDRVLWDRDWEHDYIDPDSPPHVADEMRDRMNIHPDYYTATPLDPNPQQLKRIESGLRKLVRR